MATTNINDLSIYTSNVIATKIKEIKSQYSTKQPKITGAATGLLLQDALSANLVIASDASGKIATSTVNKDKLPYLNGLQKPIIGSFGDMTKYITTTSNSLDFSVKSTKTAINDKIQQIGTNRTAYILNTSNVVSNKLNTMTLDNILQGTSKKFISNNRHESDLTVTGKLSVQNLLVQGDTFTINTDLYNTKNMDINTLSTQSIVALKLTSTNGSTNLLELKSNTNATAMVVSSSGKVGIGKSIPTYSLDVNGIINISPTNKFRINNRQIAYQDLSGIPSTFIPSVHTHNISEITNLQTVLDAKQNTIGGLVLNSVANRIDITNKDLNLGAGYRFKINGINISDIVGTSASTSATPSVWATSSSNISRDLVKITPDNITINNTISSTQKGLSINEGNLITYSGDIIAYRGNISTKNVIANNNILINNGQQNQWRIYANNDDQYDLNFENSVDNGLNWTTRAKMRGSTAYPSTVYTNFTGIHHCRANTQELYDDKYIGYIVSVTKQFSGMNSIYSSSNLQRNFDKSAWDFLPVVSLSSRPCDKSVFGIISKIEGTDPNERQEVSGNMLFPIEKKEFDRRLHVAGTGEGGVWVCDYNGNLEAGEFITTSPINGVGMKQHNDLVYNYTVGKITMDCDFNPRVILSTSNITMMDMAQQSEVSIWEEYEYEIKYLQPDGDIIDKNKYLELQSSNLPVYKMAFVGCSYNCS